MADYFPHPRQSLAGIHPKKVKDGCPINNVGHDRNEEEFPILVILIHSASLI
jgi:hypothetical protein